MNASALRRAAGRSLLAIAALVLGALVCEAGLRAFAPQPLITPVNESFLGVAAPRADMRGRVALPGEYDTQVSINAEHFRMTRPVALSAPAGTVRIAMLGDSVTFGVGADDESTYPAQLERRLNDAGSRGPRLEVLNAGVVGTGTGEQAVWYDRWVSRFRPRVVVLTVFFNDVDDDRQRGLMRATERGVEAASPAPAGTSIPRTLTHLPGYTYLVGHSHVAALLRVAGSGLLASGAARSAGEAPYDRHAFVSEGLPLQAAEILFLRDRVAAGGGRLFVVSVPVRQLVEAGAEADPGATWKSETITRSLGELCTRAGIPFVDVAGGLRERADRGGRRLYFAHDSHPTPDGYRAIAEIVSRFVEAQVL